MALFHFMIVYPFSIEMVSTVISLQKMTKKKLHWAYWKGMFSSNRKDWSFNLFQTRLQGTKNRHIKFVARSRFESIYIKARMWCIQILQTVSYNITSPRRRQLSNSLFDCSPSWLWSGKRLIYSPTVSNIPANPYFSHNKVGALNQINISSTKLVLYSCRCQSR